MSYPLDLRTQGGLTGPRDWYDIDITSATEDFEIETGFAAIALAAGSVTYRPIDATDDRTSTLAANNWISPDGSAPGGFLVAIRMSSAVKTYRIIRY